jgi:PAS domain S-box-containing protein
MKSNIARKLIIYTVLFSSVITLIITILQLYTEFRYDVKSINQSLDQIKISYLNSITQSVWLSDKEQLQIILNGITELPDIVYAEISTENNTNIFSGLIPQSDIINFNTELNYTYNNKQLKIGEFKVTASLKDVYSRLLNRLWVILFSNALKTSLVAVFIYFLFSSLVTRHLTKISEFSECSDIFSKSKPLVLDRSKGEKDEFDTVVESINDMHGRLHEQISEINKQKQHLSQTLNSIGDAVITTDNKGKVTRLNPVAEQLTGWSNKEALQQPLNTIFPIVDASTRVTIANPVEKVLATGETVYLSNHTTLIAKDGSEYQIADSAAPIRDKDKILGMVLVFNNVTEQYQMREALHESEQRLRQLAENLNEVFWLGSPDWNEIIYISPAYEKIWGMSTQSLYDHPRIWIDSIHPDDKQQVIEDIPENPADIIDCLEFREFRIIQPNLKTIWIKARAYPIRNKEDKVIRIAGIAEDITDRKLSDDTIRRSQKMDALGKLTGGIAHDYNNMLGVVLGYADILSSELNEHPKLQEYTKKIMHAGERGAKLTKKLLNFSSTKSFDAHWLIINNVLLDEQDMLEKTLTARITLELLLEPDLCPVHLDESELEDAIVNISINSMHAINGNGRLTIQTQNKQINSIEATQLALKPGKYVKLSIADNGCGMNQETKEKVFDPFFSTKGEKGTGLGLSQVYGFITRCGGSIKVDSTMGEGSCFTLYFPCRSKDKESAST